MTNRRPSLLQARSAPHAHAHAHSAYKLGHAHGHDQHLHHQYPHDAVAGPRPDDAKPDSDQGPDVQERAVSVSGPKPGDVITPSASSLVTEVIQTVSLVQIVDSLGSPVETLTRFAVPNTVVIDKNTGKTISASNPDHTPAPAAPGSSPGPSGGISSSTSSTSSNSQTGATASASAPSSSAQSSSAQSSPAPSSPASSPITPSPIVSSYSASPSAASLSPPAHSSPPTAPAVSSIGIGHNGTNIHHSIHQNSTNSMFHAESVNNTASSTKFSSTTTRHKFPAHSEISSSKFSYSHIYSPVTSYESTPTGAFGGVYGGDSAATAGMGAAPTPSASSNSTDGALSPQQKQVIGGVVGGLAGAAFFLVLVLLALRYKRRQLNAAEAAIQNTSEPRELPPTTGAPNGAPSGGNGGGGGAAMTERYSAAGLTAAFASLVPKRLSTSADTTETGERGFYRVSGRKLPSVLQVGGDGYSDPRSSYMSGTSDWNRGSQAFDPFGGAGARLQLGVPMRPDSGVPIVRSGPARAVVAEANPFADPPRTPPADASVPSLMRQRESPGRGSRFQEGI